MNISVQMVHARPFRYLGRRAFPKVGRPGQYMWVILCLTNMLFRKSALNQLVILPILFQTHKHRFYYYSLIILACLIGLYWYLKVVFLSIFNCWGFLHLFFIFPSVFSHRWHLVCLMGHLNCCFTQFSLKWKLVAAVCRWGISSYLIVLISVYIKQIPSVCWICKE